MQNELNASTQTETSALQINPNPVSTGNTETPTDDWTLDRLANYVQCSFVQGNKAHEESEALAKQLKFVCRTSILNYFRAGKALAIARERLKAAGEWCSWLEDNHLCRKTVLIAITIFEQGKTEEQVAKFTLAEAKRMWCQNTPRPVKVTTPPTVTDVVKEFEANPPKVQSSVPKNTLPFLVDHVTKEIETVMAMPEVAAEYRILVPKLDRLALLILQIRERLVIPVLGGVVNQVESGVSSGNMVPVIMNLEVTQPYLSQ